jgi:hypothetical protein
VRSLRLAAVVAAVGALACGGSDKGAPAKADAGSSAPAKPSIDFSGSVTGVVKLAEGQTLPLTAALTPGTKNTVIPPGCPPLSDDDRRPVSEQAETHALSPIHVAITGMSAAPPRAPQTHEVTIEGCRLKPKLVAAMNGDKLKVINRSQTAFLPVLPKDPFMQAILSGDSREAPISFIGPSPLSCGFGSYCGESLLVSTAHSLYAVTDAQGHFTISGVPLDQELTIHAWNPVFEATSAPFKLTREASSKTIELALTPLAPAEPTSPGR